MKKIFAGILFNCVALLSSLAIANSEGMINGVVIHAPEGWVFQSDNSGGYFLNHSELPFLFNVSPYLASSFSDLEQKLIAGTLLDDVASSYSGKKFVVNNDVVGFYFNLELNGLQTFAVILARKLVEPQRFLTIIGTTYDASIVADVTEVGKQLILHASIAHEDQSPQQAEWFNGLQDKKLSYIYTYNDTDPAGGFTAESTTHYISLCRDQSFNRQYHWYMNVSVTGAGTATNRDKINDYGQWFIFKDEDGNPVLWLASNENKFYFYTLQKEDSKIFVNGYRFYHTSFVDEGYEPNCPQ